MAWYEITDVEASYRKPNWEPEGPLGWSFSIHSEPVDGGAPHRELLAEVAGSFPTAHLTLSDHDNTGDYLDGFIEWDGSELVIWSERQKNFFTFGPCNENPSKGCVPKS